MSEVHIQHFYDESTGTLSYVVSDKKSGHAAVIDPVISYSTVSGRIDAAPADEIVEYVHKEKLGVEWILETHAHADHVTGAQYVKSKLGGTVAIGEASATCRRTLDPFSIWGRHSLQTAISSISYFPTAIPSGLASSTAP